MSNSFLNRPATRKQGFFLAAFVFCSLFFGDMLFGPFDMVEGAMIAGVGSAVGFVLGGIIWRDKT